MSKPQPQDPTERRTAATAESQFQHPVQEAAKSSQNNHPPNKDQQTTTTTTRPRRNSISVWAAGGFLTVDVGNGHEGVKVPNPYGREPTREEIHQALVAAGHQERADELADRAWGNVSGHAAS